MSTQTHPTTTPHTLADVIRRQHNADELINLLRAADRLDALDEAAIVIPRAAEPDHEVVWIDDSYDTMIDLHDASWQTWDEAGDEWIRHAVETISDRGYVIARDPGHAAREAIQQAAMDLDDRAWIILDVLRHDACPDRDTYMDVIARIRHIEDTYSAEEIAQMDLLCDIW